MATKQGMCRNCGSLIIFDEREQNCECVFCHCSFPSAEALALLENPEGHEFKNEKFESTGNGRTFFPVSPDVVESAVKRDMVSNKNSSDSKSKQNEYEVSPNDVKAPPKVVAAVIAGAAIFVLVVVLIALPLRNSRKTLHDSITGEIKTVFDGVAEVDTTLNDKGYANGYYIYGQTCQNIKVSVKTGVSVEDAKTLYSNYSALRSEKLGKTDSNVVMEIYTPNGIFTVDNSGCNFEEDSFQIKK